MSYSKTFFYVGLFFILGIWVQTLRPLDGYLFIFLYFVFCIFILSLFNKYYLFLGVILLGLLFGMIRVQIVAPEISDAQIDYYNEQRVEVLGLINKEPDQRQDKVRYEVKSQEVKVDNDFKEIKGKILVTSFLFPEYEYGDQVKLNCQLKTPTKIEDFEYDKYLSRYDIYSLCYYPKISLIKKNQGNYFLTQIYKSKNYFVSRINLILPEPHASFLAGILIGAKKSIPNDLTEVFNITGTTHIIAVSGYNVAIMANFLLLMSVHFYISRKRAFWIIIILLIIFDIITGLQASIIRASIMGVLVLLASYLGRLNVIKNVLVLTACIMILINPKILVYDLGFQLSFLATLGLIYLNPIISGILKIKKIKNDIVKIVIGDYFLTTMSAIIITTPLILNKFGKISFVAPLANILILPFIPISMMLGFIAGLISIFSLTFGSVFAWSVWLVLNYIIWALESLADLNWAYYEVSQISNGIMVVSYLGIIFLIYKYKKYLKN